MELINQTKTVFKLGKNKEGNDVNFFVGEIREVSEELAKTLLRYEGINTLNSLKVESEKVFARAKAKSKKAETSAK